MRKRYLSGRERQSSNERKHKDNYSHFRRKRNRKSVCLGVCVWECVFGSVCMGVRVYMSAREYESERDASRTKSECGTPLSSNFTLFSQKKANEGSIS